MNIMVTGCNGQLGNEIRVLSSTIDYQQLSINGQLSTINYLFTDVAELDITDFDKLHEYISSNKVDCIINGAAYTAVDKAESEPELAAAINGKAVSNLARLAKEFNILLIHVSTDYVFDGHSFKPYYEDDKTNPQSVYGKSKLQGEQEIINVFGERDTKHEALGTDRAIIIRTSWLYSSFGNNFVKTIIKYAKERGKLNVVYDQIGAPTYARDLAKAILEIIESTVHSPQSTVEIYNYANEGVCSWYDFAKTIIEISEIKCEIYPIETKDYPTPAKRPNYSVFSKDKIKAHYKITIPYWRDSLIDCLKLLKS